MNSRSRFTINCAFILIVRTSNGDLAMHLFTFFCSGLLSCRRQYGTATLRTTKWSPDPDPVSSPLRSVHPDPECSWVLTRRVTVSVGALLRIVSLSTMCLRRLTIGIIIVEMGRKEAKITTINQAKVRVRAFFTRFYRLFLIE